MAYDMLHFVVIGGQIGSKDTCSIIVKISVTIGYRRSRMVLLWLRNTQEHRYSVYIVAMQGMHHVGVRMCV